MNKYGYNYKVAQKQENFWIAGLGALALFVFIICLVLAGSLV